MGNPASVTPGPPPRASPRKPGIAEMRAHGTWLPLYDFFFSTPTKVIFIPLVELNSIAIDSHMGKRAGKISTGVRLSLRCDC